MVSRVAVNRRDGPIRNGGLNDVGISKISLGERLRELCSIFCFPGDLGNALIAVVELYRRRGCRLGRHYACIPSVVPCEASVNARTTPCFAISILNVLCS